MELETTSISVVRPASLAARLHDFYELTKPRMNFLIVITTMVGFYMASWGSMQWVLLFHTLFGTMLAASAAGSLNQFIERKYDLLMPRTQNRPLPGGRMMPWEALWFGVALAIGGVVWLALFVNVLTALLGAFTIGSYVFLYTPMKRVSTLNTVIGAVPGAIPPVMGWSACQGSLTMEALALFGILFMWQMPHFLAIATLYRDDYARGGFVMLPVVDPGLEITGRQIVIYALALIPISLMPPMLGMVGTAYLVAAVVLGLGFLFFGITAAVSKTRRDARKLFFASIIYLPVLLGVMMVNRL